MDRGAWQATVYGILQARILEWVAIIIIIELIVSIIIPIVQMGKLRPREVKQLILSGLPTQENTSLATLKSTPLATLPGSSKFIW